MRYLESCIRKDLKKKMVFVGGPRQVGKTTLAKDILSKLDGVYFNWDYDDDRQAILQKKWHDSDNLVVFDELHKFPRWKNWIKGIYDVSGGLHSFLVTGSARLDVYRRGGDSLMGRYHYWRLHPFTLDEIPAGITQVNAFDRILREDVRDLESVRNISQLGLYLDLLRQRAGSLISFANLAGDIQVSQPTAKAWLEVLERMYLVFVVRPYTKSLPRAILKAPKVYFFDNGDVLGDEGAIFENLVATSLLKRLHFLEDREGYRYELRFIRDKEGREVDFAIVKDGRLMELIEVKYSDASLSRSLVYFAEKLRPVKVTQIVAKLKRPYSKGKIEVTDPISYFSGFQVS